MLLCILLSTLLLVSSVHVNANSYSSDFDTVKARTLLGLYPDTQSEASKVADEAVTLQTQLSENGSWPDINYKDQTRAAWDLQKHYTRINIMAQSFRAPLSPQYNNTVMLKSCLLAIDFWMSNNFLCLNWWYNQINAPQLFSYIYLMLEGHLSTTEISQGIALMLRADWKNWTGANRSDMLKVQINRGLFQANESAVAEGFTNLFAAIEVFHQNEESIQTDSSFHQHGPQLLAGSYGAVFSSDLLDVMSLSVNTHYYANEEQIRIFSSLLLDGQQWMVQNKYFDFSVVGRETTRPGLITRPFSPAQLRSIKSPRSAELASWADRLEGKSTAGNPIGNRHFYDSDFMVHRRSNWTSSVYMHSIRTVAARCVNSEGKKSEHFADGVNVLLYDGLEYAEIFPTWDWKSIPGSTILTNFPLAPCSDEYGLLKTEFVNGVSDGLLGAAAMNLTSRGGLSAHKSWFYFDTFYVAMGSNINAPSKALTTIENNLSRGPVYAALAGAPASPMAVQSELQSSGLAWFHHDRTGYVIPAQLDFDQRVLIQQMNHTGNWDSIGVSSGNVTRETFNVTIDHDGVGLKAGKYQYIVVPDTQVAEMPSVYTSLNNGDLMLEVGDSFHYAFLAKQRLLQAVFWRAGIIENISAEFTVGASGQCLVIVQQSGKSVTVTVSSSVKSLTALTISTGWPVSGIGCQPTKTFTSWYFKLPTGDRLGQSVSLTCTEQ